MPLPPQNPPKTFPATSPCCYGGPFQFTGEPCPVPFCEAREEGAKYSGKPEGIPEKFLKCLWFDKRFRQPLKTVDGQSITILSPGWWNKGPGPDFLNGLYRDEKGNVVKGNVEIHVRQGDWKRHNHHKDQNYQGLALHVFFREDQGKGATPASGLQIDLTPFLTESLDDFMAEMKPGDYPLKSDSALGGCCPAIQKLTPERVAAFLEEAGETRMQEKAARFLNRLGEGGFEQLCYEGVMEALGYSKNGKMFRELARRVPLQVLLKRMEGMKREGAVLEVQSILFAASGLFPPKKRKPERKLDEEAVEYEKMIISAEGYAFGKGFSNSGKGEGWTLSGCRPTNYPYARLAAAAYLVERFRERGWFLFFRDAMCEMAPLFEGDGRKKAAKKLAETLVVKEFRDFWSTRHTPDGKKQAAPRRLMGPDRASVALANGVFPVLLAYAQSTGDQDLEQAVNQVYSHHPLLSENSVQKFMNTFLLGERYQRSPLVNSAKKQQGLIHIYGKYCVGNEKGCLGCGFLRNIESLRQ